MEEDEKLVLRRVQEMGYNIDIGGSYVGKKYEIKRVNANGWVVSDMDTGWTYMVTHLNGRWDVEEDPKYSQYFFG